MVKDTPKKVSYAEDLEKKALMKYQGEKLDEFVGKHGIYRKVDGKDRERDLFLRRRFFLDYFDRDPHVATSVLMGQDNAHKWPREALDEFREINRRRPSQTELLKFARKHLPLRLRK